MPAITGGVWPAMFTPLDDDGQVNLDAIDALVELSIGQGMDGIYLLGRTGHGPAMRLEERREVADHAIKAVNGRVPVIVHVGCLSTVDSVDLARHAAGCGADGISSIPPVYFSCDANQEFEHFRQIAAATELPFFPYHNPAVNAGAGLSAHEYAKRLMDLPNIGGIKLTVRDMFELGLMCQLTKNLVVFSGADELVCHAAVSGASGAIGTFYTLWGQAVRKVRAELIAGNFDLARGFMTVFQGVIHRYLISGSYHEFCRMSIKLKYGIDIGPGRSPDSFGPEWDEAEVQQMIEQVDAAAGV